MTVAGTTTKKTEGTGSERHHNRSEVNFMTKQSQSNRQPPSPEILARRYHDTQLDYAGAILIVQENNKWLPREDLIYAPMVVSARERMERAFLAVHFKQAEEHQWVADRERDIRREIAEAELPPDPAGTGMVEMTQE